jgi:hypothetical protein
MECLQWRCDVCHGNVDDNDGYLYVLRSEQCEIAAGQGVWRITHTACDPHLDEESDWIDVSQIRDTSTLYSWASGVVAMAQTRHRTSGASLGAEHQGPQATCQPESAAILAAFTSTAASLQSPTTSSAISAG